MFHIGMVQRVMSPGKSGTVSADESVQAVVRMWDYNLLILGVDRKLGKKIRRGDYVIADYSPLAPESPNKRFLITKILSESEGSAIWAEFQDEIARRKALMQQSQANPNQRYIR